MNIWHEMVSKLEEANGIQKCYTIKAQSRWSNVSTSRSNHHNPSSGHL